MRTGLIRQIFCLIFMICLPTLSMAAGEESENPYAALDDFSQSTNVMEDRFNALTASLMRWPEQQQAIWDSVTANRGLSGLMEIVQVFALMMFVGWVVERFAAWRLRSFSNRISQRSSELWSESLGYLLIQLLVNLISVGFFTIAAGLVAVLFYEQGSSFKVTLMLMLTTIVNIRIVSVIAKAALAPHAAGLRLFNISSGQAQNIYYWVMAFTVFYAAMARVTTLLYKHGIEGIMFALTVPLNGLFLTGLILSFIWSHRDSISAIFRDQDAEPRSREGLSQMLSNSWPTLVTLWFLAMWGLWSYHEFVGNYTTADEMSPAWWLTLLFPFIDRLTWSSLNKLKDITWLQSRTYERRVRRFARNALTCLRLVLVAAIIYTIAEALGYQTMDMIGESRLHRMFEASVDIIGVLLVAYAIWEVTQSLIERRLPEPLDEEESVAASLEGEGGGGGASRSETLLPLVRTFFAVILIITVTLSMLTIMGVEIAPLLAGAGVVGIAIGFGAQKLVQDIISGIFFLLDDAFRRGEYIEAASMRGTVEGISLRSMRLRHHLGAVQTIPYSEIQTVKNLSRDWVTMKLELRLPYDVDIEKVRKVIKKVGLAMLDDPEFGDKMLLPLKSQGVLRIEESALIVRMKFTCLPGEQWIIRREAYRRVKDALESNGIRFAHRAVHVLLPDELKDKVDELDEKERQLLKDQASAAVGESVAATDFRKQNRIDDFDADGPQE